MLLDCSAQRSLIRLLVLATVVATLGCGQGFVFPRLEFMSDEAKTPSIPLTVRLEIPEPLRQAQLFYKDSCGAPQAVPLGERLAEQVKADAAGVFERTFEGGPKDPADAVLSAALETGEMNLAISRREIGEYPLKVLVRVRVTVVDMEGKTLLNEPVKGEGKWTVTTDGTNCTVQGLMLPVTEALEKLSDRLVDRLVQSAKIRDWAVRLGTRKEIAAAGRPGGTGGTGAPPTAAVEPPTLSFLASLEDESRNQVLEAGENVVVRVEVANAGPGVARGVAIELSGTPALVKEFVNPTLLGDIHPGEKKQATISTKLPATFSEQQAELLVQVTEAGGNGPLTRKRFVASFKSGAGSREPVEVPSAEVDQIPARVQEFERRTSYALVVGLGGYREESIPRLKYARRDAEVIAKHLTALAGFPSENVRVLTDEHALLVDLQDTVEDWLPRQANVSGIVFVYLIGNAVLNAEGTDIVLMPYEGRPDLARRGYSLNRLQDVLGRLPSRLNLVFADLLFPAGDGKGDERQLPWSARKAGGTRRIVVVGSSTTNGPSLSWDAGQHGLFTYHFLKAIRGQGDADDNGWVDVGEIIAYLREQVPKGAADLNKQQMPAVSPDVKPDGPIGTFPFSKARRRG
jgi:caspase domain-containing protein